MHHAIRFTLTAFLITLGIGLISAKSAAKEAEYKQSDNHFYLRADVLKADPKATILREGSYTQTGDSYFIKGGKKPAKVVYLQMVKDWLEPITPPNMPASLNIAPDAMQIREPQGDVQVAFPTAPANFVPATDGMDLPNGSVLKTGDKGTAAVLFGGINSARLTPNSEAAVQQTVTPQLRTTEVDLHAGTVFSKVGLRPGEKQDYQVRTPMGVAAARGTDFVTVALPTRTDVWIAQGTVKLDAPDGKTIGTVSSEGTGTLKIMRNPPMADKHDAMMADAETMTLALNFIPTANVKVKTLRDQLASGTLKMTASQTEYMHRMKRIPALIMLTLVEPPPPVPNPSPVKPPEVKKVTSEPPVTMESQGKPTPAVNDTAIMPIIHKPKAKLKLRDQEVSSSHLSTSSQSKSTAAPITIGPNDTIP